MSLKGLWLEEVRHRLIQARDLQGCRAVEVLRRTSTRRRHSTFHALPPRSTSSLSSLRPICWARGTTRLTSRLASRRVLHADSLSLVPAGVQTYRPAQPVYPAKGSTASPHWVIRQHDELLRQTHQFFAEMEQLLLAAHAHHDLLDHQVADDYSTVFPIMREVLRYFAADVMYDKVAEWVAADFPMPEEAETPLAEALEHARATQHARASVEMQIQERSPVLRHPCALLGGHQPRTGRDAPHIVGERCGTPLSGNASDADER